MQKVKPANRRDFIKLSGGALLAALAGGYAWPARAGLRPSTITFAYLTDTLFPAAGEPGGRAFELADDLVSRLSEKTSGEIAALLHGGNLLRSARPEEASAAREWLGRSPWPVRLTLGASDTVAGRFSRADFISLFADFGPSDGQTFYAYDLAGFRFLHLDAAGDPGLDSSSYLHHRRRQLRWLREDLEQHLETPFILVLHPPLLTPDSALGRGLDDLDRRSLLKLIRSHPQVLLALGGKVMANSAAFLPDSSTLCLTTASTLTYPCGARLLELTVAADGQARIRSEFIQTRRLEWVEDSFLQVEKNLALARLGERKDRSLTATPSSPPVIAPIPLALNPGLAPWWSGAESVSLAVVTDTHICLDEFVSESSHKDNRLIGHYEEKEGRALLEDILDQINQGRHRIEFFDEVFARDPQADRHFLAQPVDALFLCGDLAETGRRAEAERARSLFERLRPELRRRCLMTPGNHDYYKYDFGPQGSAGSRQPLADFYRDFRPGGDSTYYAAPLSEWLTLIVLDSVIPTFNNLGLIQEQMDWLADELLQRRGQAVIVASHHTIHPLSLVPELMTAYLRQRSHFTPTISAARAQLQDLIARSPEVKLLISGHYHGVCVDQFRKQTPAGTAADDSSTTHVQVPCTVEYPCGYTLFRISREKSSARIEYQVAYSRLQELRRESSQALLYRIAGAKVKVPAGYEGTLERLRTRDTLFGQLSALHPRDLADLDLRGFKDGTARGGRGNTGKGNLKGNIEFSL